MKIEGSVTIHLHIEDSSQVGHARRVAQGLAERAGFDATDAGRVALVATELASNVLKHAGRGALQVRLIPNLTTVGVEIVAIDRGPGFDLATCLPDGVSTRGTNGIGLGAVVRQAQVFDAYADARGAAILARIYPRGGTPGDIRFGVSQHALRDDPACGDAWALAIDGKRISIVVIDGLGHGPEAEQAALAGTAAFAEEAWAPPAQLVAHLHAAMNGTRGGAAAVAQFDAAANQVQFAGIGNIGATLLTADASRGLASHPGIVGGNFRKVQVFEYPQTAGQLLVMYSDGLQSRWKLTDYPGLWHRHPALIAALLHRDYCRERDDVTVLVIALEA